MRLVQTPQCQLGEIAIADIKIDLRSRDDIPAVLRGLQLLYTHEPTRAKLFELLDQVLVSKADKTVGRPGMELWRIFVLATLKQGLNCDFDRLQELANRHQTIREMLGHSGWDDPTQYALQTLVDNVSLLSPSVLAQLNQFIVEVGHELVKKKPGDKLQGRCDSFVVETDVHYPTDGNLLWDALRTIINVVGRACEAHGIGGWRQQRYHKQALKRLLRKTQKLRHSRSSDPHKQAQQRQRIDQAYRDYRDKATGLLEKAQATLPSLVTCGAGAAVAKIEHYAAHARRQLDQIERRVLNGETIAHGEKVFSLFEPHTRWLSKGKAGVPVELGVAVCVLEDQHQFVLHHRILWDETDSDVAVAMVEHTQARFPDLSQCSFDRGFHSPANQQALATLLERPILPKKGRLSEADKTREHSDDFVQGRYQHAAVESCINNLEQRGLDRCRALGKDGFERHVALSIVAANLHRLGLIVQAQEKARLAQQARRKPKRRLAA